MVLTGDDTVLGEVYSHLRMIEHAYGVTITNKEELCGWILRATRDRREILTIALAFNNYVAIRGASGDLAIPQDQAERVIAATVGRW